MVDLTTRPPEVQPELIDPRVGTYRAEGGQFFSGIADAISNMARLRTAQENTRPDLSSYVLALTDPRDVEDLTGVPSTQSDVEDLKSAASASIKLDKAASQNSSYRRGSARRIALTREFVAANPQYAPEFMDMFKLVQGEGLGKTIAGLEKDQDAEAKQYREYVLDQAPKMGLDPSASFQELSERVRERDDLINKAAESAAHLQLLKNSEDTKNINMQNYIQKNILPGYVASSVKGLNELVAKYDPANPDLKQRQLILNKLANNKSLLRSQLLASGYTDLPSLDNLMSTFDEVNKQVTDYLDGKTTLEALQSGNNMLIKLAERNLLNQPNVPTILAIGQYMGDAGISKFMEGFSRLGLDVAMGRAFSNAVSAVTGTPIRPKEEMRNLGVTTPEQQRQYYQDASNAIAHLSTTQDPEAIQAAKVMLDQYVASVADDEYDGRLFEQILNIMDKPEVVKELGMPPDFTNALSNYTADITAAIQEDVGQAVGGKTATATFFDPNSGAPVPIQKDNKDLFDWGIMENTGEILFTAKAQNDPKDQAEANRVVSNLNKKYSKKFAKLVNVIHAYKGGSKEEIGLNILSGNNPFRVQPKTEAE